MKKTDKQREKFVTEMNRLSEAIKKTDSKYLKNDYHRALVNMRKELRDYDRFKQEANAQ